MALAGGRQDMAVIRDAILALEQVYHHHGRPFYLYKTPYSS